MHSLLLLPGLALVVLGFLVFLIPEKLWGALPLPTALRTAHASSAALALFTGVTVVGVGLVIGGTRDAIRGRASSNWTATSATILSSSLEESREARTGRKQWRPNIRYEYQVGGRRFEASRLSFGLATFPDGSGGVEAVIARYAPGTLHTVYVDPADPARAVLRPGLDVLMVFFAGIGIAFVVVGVLQLRMLRREWNPPDVVYVESA